MLAFSDLQADITAELVRRGLNVVTFNQRSVAEILQMIRMLGGLVGCQARPRRWPTGSRRASTNSRVGRAVRRRGRGCFSKNGTIR